jgi:hypothetical protein
VLKRRGSSVAWNGVAVLVTSRLVSRYFWMTASIDVWVDGNRVLRSGGVLRFTGNHSETFRFGDGTQQVKLTWGAGWLRSFPFKLQIDDVLVAESRVVIENWWLMFWPFFLAMGFVFVRLALQH